MIDEERNDGTRWIDEEFLDTDGFFEYKLVSCLEFYWNIFTHIGRKYSYSSKLNKRLRKLGKLK